jgi:hypothetical protein
VIAIVAFPQNGEQGIGALYVVGMRCADSHARTLGSESPRKSFSQVGSSRMTGNSDLIVAALL